jgi:hypothetical protein
MEDILQSHVLTMVDDTDMVFQDSNGVHEAAAEVGDNLKGVDMEGVDMETAESIERTMHMNKPTESEAAGVGRNVESVESLNGAMRVENHEEECAVTAGIGGNLKENDMEGIETTHAMGEIEIGENMTQNVIEGIETTDAVQTTDAVEGIEEDDHNDGAVTGSKRKTVRISNASFRQRFKKTRHAENTNETPESVRKPMMITKVGYSVLSSFFYK